MMVKTEKILEEKNEEEGGAAGAHAHEHDGQNMHTRSEHTHQSPPQHARPSQRTHQPTKPRKKAKRKETLLAYILPKRY